MRAIITGDPNKKEIQVNGKILNKWITINRSYNRNSFNTYWYDGETSAHDIAHIIYEMVFPDAEFFVENILNLVYDLVELIPGMQFKNLGGFPTQNENKKYMCMFCYFYIDCYISEVGAISNILNIYGLDAKKLIYPQGTVSELPIDSMELLGEIA